MKKYLVIGNPIDHSLSPKLHNYWIKKNNIEAIYEKEKIEINELEDLILRVKKKEIDGANITVPYKKKIIDHLDVLSDEAEKTRSVNTICLINEKIVGYNTDIAGFKSAIEDTNFDVTNKKILILGAGGVVSSIIFALQMMKASEITVSNRTREKAEDLKRLFNYIKISDWGKIPNCEMIINATSVGLNSNDQLDIDFSVLSEGKFFYDIIYNPPETMFLKLAKKKNNNTENGKNMFIHQAAAAFKIWHNIELEIDNEVKKLLD